MEKIEIVFKDGDCHIWDGKEGRVWDDYAYDGHAFIVKRSGCWVGIYNFDTIAYIFVH